MARKESYATISVGTKALISLQIAKATAVCTVHIQKRSYSIDEDRNQLSQWNSGSPTIKPFGLIKTGNHQQCQVIQLCMDIICSGYIAPSTICAPVISSPASRSVLSRKTERVKPPFAGLKLPDSCEGEVEAQIDILVGADHCRNLFTGIVVQESQDHRPSIPRWVGFCSGPVHCPVSSSTTSCTLATFKMNLRFFNHCCVIPMRRKCQMWANFLKVDFLGTTLEIRNRKKNSSSLFYILNKTWLATKTTKIFRINASASRGWSA